MIIKEELKKHKKIGLLVCPECGSQLTIEQWNEGTRVYFSDESLVPLNEDPADIIPMEHSSMEDIFVCIYCRVESTRREIEEASY
jgi:uncharacterized protein YbaR (Trm112 family)